MPENGFRRVPRDAAGRRTPNRVRGGLPADSAGDTKISDVTPEERSVLERLDGILRRKEILAEIEAVIGRVRAELARKRDAVMTWEPIPLAIFGEALPGGIRSSWVFVLRAGVNTGAERHPNSRQRMMSFDGVGDLQVRPDLDSPWSSHVLGADPMAPLEQRWISIPTNTWHQPVIGKGSDWVVISFHTVPAEELIEERPDPTSETGTKQMVYLEEG